ncbi:MAG: hypothetical protein M3Z02_12960 [Actinomycetota bacterium]|nr:hypothetical protein [Actinomycetota bacterium]
MRPGARLPSPGLPVRLAAGVATLAGVLLGAVTSLEYYHWRRLRRDLDRGNRVLLDALRGDRADRQG